jgi:hypothetical protein
MKHQKADSGHCIEEEKLHVAKVDNQKLKGKSIQIGIFLLGIQDRKFGNWSKGLSR